MSASVKARIEPLRDASLQNSIQRTVVEVVEVPLLMVLLVVGAYFVHVCIVKCVARTHTHTHSGVHKSASETMDHCCSAGSLLVPFTQVTISEKRRFQKTTPVLILIALP